MLTCVFSTMSRSSAVSQKAGGYIHLMACSHPVLLFGADLRLGVLSSSLHNPVQKFCLQGLVWDSTWHGGTASPNPGVWVPPEKEKQVEVYYPLWLSFGEWTTPILLDTTCQGSHKTIQTCRGGGIDHTFVQKSSKVKNAIEHQKEPGGTHLLDNELKGVNLVLIFVTLIDPAHWNTNGIC